MILEKMRSCLWKLKLGFWTCVWIHPVGPSGPNVGSKAPGPKFKTHFQISWFYWIHLIILEKTGSCLWKLELGFSTTGLIRHLPKAFGPNCAKVVFRPQIPNVFWDLKFFSCQAAYNFASNKLLFSNFRSILIKLWVFHGCSNH